MKFLQLISEGRVEDFISKFGYKFNSEQLRRITDLIPQKFLEWVGKNLDAIEFDKSLSTLNSVLNNFQKISSNLPKTDINQYKSIQELVDAISEYNNKSRREYRKVEGGNVVYEDDRFFIVNPQDHKSSCYYGKGTKWCTAADSDFNFTKYNEDGKLFYFLDKKLKTDDPFYKVALLLKFEGDKSWWDAKDNSFSKGWILGTPELEKMFTEIENYMESEYPEQLKIFKDKLAAKKERERLENLRIARRKRQLESDAESRREDNEWALGPDCPEEGLKAHALLDWLVSNGDVDALTNEDKTQIDFVTAEIERLTTEYDNSEDVETDLLDQISDLEDEREELEKKIDVYNIVPDGDYYTMTRFEVIDSPDLENRTYVVGTEDEMDESAKEYVEQLIDDIGYEGFSKSFAVDYLDRGRIEAEARDIFENDVNDNPEVYLDESERQLSSKQEEKIAIYEKKIQNAEEMIERLEGDEESEEAIEELQDKISEYEDEIEEIKSNPDGDFPYELIEEKVEELVENATDDLEGFLNEYGMSWDDYIDKDEFVQGVIDADGYGHTINSYDGNADEMEVQGQTFWVMRID